MRYYVSREGRNEVLKHAIANIYYYLEMSDDETLMFQYQIKIRDGLSEILKLNNAESEIKDDVMKAEITRLLISSLGIRNVKILDYTIQPSKTFETAIIKYDVEMTKEDYLDCIYNRLYDIIPLVDYFCRHMEVDLEGVAQKYGLSPHNLLTPIGHPDFDCLGEWKKY